VINLRDLSLRYKIPLRVAALSAGTAFVLASTLVYRDTIDLRNNLIGNADRMGQVIANTLAEPMLYDDVYRAYEIINTPFQLPAIHGSSQNDEYLLILDRSNHVYASTKPQRFPMLQDPVEIDHGFEELLKALPDTDSSTTAVVEPDNSANLFLLIPVRANGARIGTLVMSYPKAPFIDHFIRLTEDAAVITLLVLAVLLPLSVYWGNRMAKPLLQLSSVMSTVTTTLPEPGEIVLEESGDEIGQLAKAFKRMLAELKEKEQLQQHIVSSDRLAAIGRLTAGIAHEINNPLGGMLNAISTFKRHGTQDPVTQKTISILERGLLQIKETVAALLVEAKARSRPFDSNDIEDICTLIQSNVQAKRVHFTHDCEIVDGPSIPSTLARQVIINLLLNAIQATKEQGHVHLHIYRDGDSLTIIVANDGSYIPPEKIVYLFEPFTLLSENGHGLGLWVIYQIVQQLGGNITVKSEPNDTLFTVQIPLQEDI
jgi:signal transduction histidine kinase